MMMMSPFTKTVLVVLAASTLAAGAWAAELPKDPDKLSPAKAVDAWLAVVEDEAQPSVRRNYAEGQIVALGKCAVPRLLEIWATAPHERRGRVAEIFGMMQDLPDAAVEALMSELTTQKHAVHPHVVRALADLRVKKAVPLMIAAWPDADDELRMALLHALGRVGDERAADIFLASLDSPDRLVQTTAADALIRVLGALRASPDAGRKDVYRPLMRKTLDYAEKGATFESRRVLAGGLGRVEDPEAAPLLRRLLRGLHTDLSVKKAQAIDMRVAAAQSLGLLRCCEAVDELITAARSDDPMLRRAALDALIAVDDESCIPALVQLLEDCAPKERREVVRALRQIARQPFGENPDPWRAWWEEYKKRDASAS